MSGNCLAFRKSGRAGHFQIRSLISPAMLYPLFNAWVPSNLRHGYLLYYLFYLQEKLQRLPQDSLQVRQ